MNDDTTTTSDSWVTPSVGDTTEQPTILYRSGNVFQDTKFQSRGPKTDMPVGRLILIRKPTMEGQTICFRWTATPDNNSRNANDYDVDYPISQIHSFKRKSNRLMVVLSERGEPSSTLPPFIFEAGAPAVKKFLAHIQVNLASLSGENTPSLKPVVDDFNLFVVERKERGSVAKAIAEQIQEKTKKFSEVKWKLLESASEVTHFFRHAVTNVSNSLSNSAHTMADDQSFVQMQPLFEAPSSGGGTSALVSPSSSGEPGPAVDVPETNVPKDTSVHCREQQKFGDLGAFDVMDSAPSKPWAVAECSREDPISVEEWHTYFSKDTGIMLDWNKESELRRRIFKGGFCPEIRAEGWKFLFGHIVPCGVDDADAFWESKKLEYETMKTQWQSVSHTQMLYNSAFRERIERVAKDVARTDRETLYFRDNGRNIENLGNILNTWCMYNFDLGYVQGMSDMAAVILSVVDDEADAFWCFVGLMDTEHGAQANFATNQLGMKQQLSDLQTLVRFLDPALMDALEENDCGNMYFAFRWLLVFLKREFKVPDVVLLWDSMWARHLTTKFHLFVCLAIIKVNRESILTLEFDSMLQHFTSLAGSLDVNRVLRDAEAICVDLAQRGHVPASISEFFDTDLWNDTESDACVSVAKPENDNAIVCDDGSEAIGQGNKLEDQHQR